MVKKDLKFLDATDDCWINCKAGLGFNENQKFIIIQMYNEYSLDVSEVYLDKGTAIKFSKALRKEIKKIKS